MFHWYRKASTVFAAALFLLLLAACSTPNALASEASSTPTVSTSGARSRSALLNTQHANTYQATTLSDLTLTVQPYPTPFTVYEFGDSMSHVVATGTDDLGPGDPITATIDWGDKTAPTQYTFIDGRTFQISGAHAYSKVGKYTITVTAAITIFQQSVSGTGTITVVPAYTINVKNIQLHTIGQTFRGVIATGTDPFTNDTLSGTVNWGDNTTSTNVQAVSDAKGNFQVNTTHTYSQMGSFTITVSLSSIIVGPISGTGTASVALAFTLKAGTIKVKASQLFHGSVATVTGTVSSKGLRVIIEWGDQTSSKFSQGGGKGHIKIQGRHTYSQAGTYTFTVIIEDLGTGEQAHASGVATVK
jgi:hypothetical protein